MEITLTFKQPLNSSLQIGDTVWYTTPSSAGGYDVATKDSVTKLGTVEELSSQYRAHEIKISNYVLASVPDVVPVNLTANSFIMFSKNDIVNLGSVSGYFAEVQLRNNSTEKIELFALSSEVVQSSK